MPGCCRVGFAYDAASHRTLGGVPTTTASPTASVLPVRRHSPAIDVSGLIKTFGSLRALDGLDLDVETGQIHGFLGPNGAGKSTTIRVLLGMYRRDSGVVRVLGMDPRHDAERITRRCAYVPGDVALWPTLTGAQTLDALAALRGGRDRAREADLIEAFRLDPHKPVRSYSKGNRQKVMLVAALAAPCDLVILDEPTSGLDPLQAEVFVEAVRYAAGQGRTVLMSSHIMAEVDRLCDSVTIIKDGRTVESGRLRELRHLRASRITCVLPPDQSSPPGRRRWARLLHLERDPRRAPAETTTHVTLPPPDADGRLSVSVPADRVPAALQQLLAAGAQEVTCAPASLDEVFLQHYEAAAR